MGKLWGHHVRVREVRSPCTGAGGVAEGQQVMGWFNLESVTSQPHHHLTVGGERCSLYRSALGSPYMEKGLWNSRQ